MPLQAALLIAFLLVTPLALAAHTEQSTYVGPTHDTSARSVDCRLPQSVAVNGACFALGGSDRHVRISIADASGLPIPTHAFFRNATGIAVGPALFFCSSTVESDVPADAVVLLVWPLPDDSIDGHGYCPDVHGTATAGTITLDFA